MKLRYTDFAERLDIDEFYDAINFVPVSTKGDEDTGHCPDIWGMHKNGDQTGKFSINRDKCVYNCWVCGGGSLLLLAMEYNDMDPEDATHWLYQFTRTEQTLVEFYDEMEALLSDPIERKPVMPYYNEKVLDKLTTPIVDAVDWDPKTKGWVNFLERRGISESVAERFKLRYNLEAIRFAPPKLGEENYIGPAVTFPHYWRGRLVGWQQRWLDPERPKWVPKYTNTPDFPKSNTIFNYRNDTKVVVVESVPSALYLESLHIPAIATFSTPKIDQIKLMRIIGAGIIISADNDQPGINGRRVMTECLEKYIPIEWFPMIDKGPGADIGDLTTEELVEHFARRSTPLEWELSDV